MREPGIVPSTAQSAHQHDGFATALELHREIGLLGLERCGLCGNDLEIVGSTVAVAVERQLLTSSRRLRREFQLLFLPR